MQALLHFPAPPPEQPGEFARRLARPLNTVTTSKLKTTTQEVRYLQAELWSNCKCGSHKFVFGVNNIYSNDNNNDDDDVYIDSKPYLKRDTTAS